MAENNKPTLVILAAGMGSRYGGLKQLDGVGPNDETIIEYSIYDAIQAGFGKVVCVIRDSFEKEFKERILSSFEGQIEMEVAFQDLSAYVPKSVTTEREKPWGTGHAILCAKNQVHTPFAVINADDFYGRESFQQMAKFLMEGCSPSHYGMVGFLLKKTLSPFGPVSRGVCTINEEGHLVTVREHVEIVDVDGLITGEWEGDPVELLENTRVSMNLWGFHPNLFEYLEQRFSTYALEHGSNPKAEFYIPLAVNELLDAERIKVSVIPSGEKWYGVTYKDDKEDVQNAVSLMVNSGIYPTDLSNG